MIAAQPSTPWSSRCRSADIGAFIVASVEQAEGTAVVGAYAWMRSPATPFRHRRAPRSQHAGRGLVGNSLRIADDLLHASMGDIEAGR